MAPGTYTVIYIVFLPIFVPFATEVREDEVNKRRFERLLEWNSFL